MTVVGKLVAARVPQHVRVYAELEAGRFAGVLDQAGNPLCRERRLTFGDEHVFTALGVVLEQRS
jgi:hypothetical protein